MTNIQEHNPIRVLCVFSWLDRGGAESMCMNIYRNIDRTKVQFDFVKHTDRKCDFEDEILSLGGRVFAAPRYLEYNRLSYQKWWNNHFQNHPEHKIVHSHYFTISDVFLKIAKKHGRYTINHCHQSSLFINERKSIKSLLIWLHIRHNIKYSNLLMACSEKAGKWGYGNRKFDVIHNVIDCNAYKYDEATRYSIREQLGISEKTFVVGTVGRIMNVKNPYGTVEIFDNVLKLKENAKLLWVGPDATMGAEIKREIDRRGLKERTIFTGQVTNVNQMLQAMDCFILPSFSEGMPVTLIEAQASGLPCYASDAITSESRLTDCCQFLSIDDYTEWASAIVNQTNIRSDKSQEVKERGFDILETRDYLQELYLSI